MLTSEHYTGREVADVYRHLAGRRFAAVRGVASRPDQRARRGGYLLPAGAGGRAADSPNSSRDGIRAIDVSADFRLKDPAAYRATYGADHPAPALLKEAVYGLSEFHRRELREARVVANPGCYPTGSLLGILPLIRRDLIDPVTRS